MNSHGDETHVHPSTPPARFVIGNRESVTLVGIDGYVSSLRGMHPSPLTGTLMITHHSFARSTTQTRSILALSIALALGTATFAKATLADTLNLETATIADFNKAFASGKLSSEKVVAAYLKRIEAYDKK